MKSIEFTIYDIVAYLIPGVLVLVALSVIFWSLACHGPADLDSISAVAWWVFGLLAYILGHMAQALANHIVRFCRETIDLVFSTGTPLSAGREMIDAGEGVAKKILKADASATLAPVTIFAVCDTYLLQKGAVSTRDVYLYREGFYRGLVVAFGMLTIAFAIRCFFPISELVIQQRQFTFGLSHLVWFAALSATIAVLSWQRFRRFGKYGIVNSLLSAVILDSLGEKTKDTTP